jgi:hypothetical protein
MISHIHLQQHCYSTKSIIVGYISPCYFKYFLVEQLDESIVRACYEQLMVRKDLQRIDIRLVLHE